MRSSPNGLGLNDGFLGLTSDSPWAGIMGCFGQPGNRNSRTVFRQFEAKL